MLTRLLPLLVLALATLSGCYAHGHAHLHAGYVMPTHLRVTTAPPPLRAEVTVRPPQPAPASVWVHGHWQWHGSAWVWEAGHWTTPPSEDQVWTAPVVVRASGGFHYHPGHWRPASSSPSGAYAGPSDAPVSHQAPPVVDVPHVGGATASGGAGTTTEPATPPATPTVTATGTGTVTASGTGTVAPATPPATVSGGTVTASGTGTVTARPTATGSGTVSGTTGTVTTPGSTTVTRPGGTVTTGPGTTEPARPTGAGTVTVAGGGTVSGTTEPANRGNLRCSINTPRAPSGGLITVSGNGFGSNTVVRVGGHTAAIVNRQGSQIRAQVPRNSRGGMVAVTTGNRSANCGRLEIIGR